MENDQAVAVPESGDRAFETAGPRDEAACIPHGSWWEHGNSYKDTADIVVRQALADPQSLDFVILPVCFLYRHYLELGLKALAQDASTIRGKEPPKSNHDLQGLWSFIRGVFGNAGSEMVDATESLLAEWATYDKGSYAFRYPTDKKGRPSLPAHLTHLNIRRLSDTINKIAVVFGGLAEYLSVGSVAVNDAMSDPISDPTNGPM